MSTNELTNWHNFIFGDILLLHVWKIDLSKMFVSTLPLSNLSSTWQLQMILLFKLIDPSNGVSSNGKFELSKNSCTVVDAFKSRAKSRLTECSWPVEQVQERFMFTARVFRSKLNYNLTVCRSCSYRKHILLYSQTHCCQI